MKLGDLVTLFPVKHHMSSNKVCQPKITHRKSGIENRTRWSSSTPENGKCANFSRQWSILL